MAQPPLPPLPRQVFEGDLSPEERKVLRARYRRIMRKMRANQEVNPVERALHLLLALFTAYRVVTLDNLEALVDAEFDDIEQDQGGPEQLVGEEAEDAFEAAIMVRIQERAAVRVHYEAAMRILMNPMRRGSDYIAP